MGWSDLENENRLRYEGQRRGWKTGPISQSQLLALTADEYEFRRVVDPKNFQLALEGRDKQTLLDNWAKQLVPAKVYAEVTRNGVTMHSRCYTHPDMDGFVVRLDNGEYWRASAFAGVRYVDEIPDSGKPKNLQQAKEQHTQEGIAAANERDERRRGMQTGIEVTATPLGAMADKAKQIHVAQITR